MTSTTPFDPASATIAIVTYNRSGLLTRLLESITRMDPKPGHVVIIDNASVDDTTELVESFRDRLGTELVYQRLETNTGGSGGFSEGMRVAYELGSTWMWLMDDDVEVLPDGLARMGAWAPRFKSIQGRRYDYDGSEFYWQYRVAEPLGIPIPFAPAGFDESGFKEMNSGCFEGMFIHRDIVAEIGLPDPALLHLLGRPDVRLARLPQDDLGHRERVRAAPHARDQAVGHGHPPHERLEQRVPVLHHAQPRPHEELLPLARRVQPGAVRRRHGAHLRQGAHPPARRRAHRAGHEQPVPRHPRRSADRARCLVEADAAARRTRPSEISPRCSPRCSGRALRRSARPWRARPCRGTDRACRSGAGPSRCG